VKDYGGLRPFRLRSLSVGADDTVWIEGPDKQAAAVLTDLITGTTLPDAGIVAIGGRPTSSLSTQDEWLAFLDRFGIVNDRVVLLEELTVAQNLAVPLTLDLDPLPVAIRRSVERLAADLGLDAAAIDAPLRGSPPAQRWLVCLGRALALRPAILLVEHPTSDLADPRDVAAVAESIRRVRTQSLAIVLVSSDRRLPRNVTARSLTWRAANGDTREWRDWRRWFSITAQLPFTPR